MKKNTFAQRLVAGLKALGYAVDTTNKSRYLAFVHPEKENKAFVGSNGALRAGRSASNSMSMGDPSNLTGWYRIVLKKGDEVLAGGSKLTEDQAVRYVHDHARYHSAGVPLPDGTKGGLYAVERDGVIIHSNDTRELVEKLLKT